jgi:anti-anti-sigma factor
MATTASQEFGAASFVVRVMAEGSTTTLKLEGELDAYTAASLEGIADTVRTGRPEIVVLDVFDLEFMNAVGLSALVEIVQPIIDGGGRAIAMGASRLQLMMFEMSPIEAGPV